MKDFFYLLCKTEPFPTKKAQQIRLLQVKFIELSSSFYDAI